MRHNCHRGNPSGR